MEDAVRPSKETIKFTQAKSRRLWSLAECSQLPLQCIQPQAMLARVPAYLGCGHDSRSKEKEKKKHSLSLHQISVLDGLSTLFVSGKSTWLTSSSKECSLGPRVLPHQLLLGVQNTTACVFMDDSCFSHWPGVHGTLDGAEQGNYIAVLFYAWAYILSATWLEIQPSNLAQTGCMSYLDCQAVELEDNKPHDGLEINLHSASDDATRWWAAVLAAPAGWQATVSYNGQTYRSPWSVSNIDARPFVLRRAHHTESTPPSSSQALEYLAEFCAARNIGGQCCAALMAALFIPFNNGSRTITLPLPIPYDTLAAALPSRLADDIYGQMELLPYYMTLSCNGWALRSLLHSTFFNPDVYCNLVGAWLEPAFEAIDSIVDAGDYIALATILTQRKPMLGSLWLGAIVTGTAKTIFQAVRSGHSAIDLHVAAWTASEQSFLNTSRPGPCVTANQSKIYRDDECRLLFLTGCDGYSSVPVYPWKPFGSTLLVDTEIAVRLHARCPGHGLRYSTWNWDLDSGIELEDKGFNTTAFALKPVESKSMSKATSPLIFAPRRLNLQSVSEAATRGIFGWLRMTGYPPCEKEIRTHPWFDVGDSDEESCDEASSTLS